MLNKHEGIVYDYICHRLDAILIKTRVRDKCKKCAQGKYVRKPKWMSSNNGCCHGCENLGKDGCKGESMACKFWFCNRPWLATELEKHGLLEEWQALRKLAADVFQFHWDYDHEFFRKIKPQI